MTYDLKEIRGHLGSGMAAGAAKSVLFPSVPEKSGESVFWVKALRYCI